VQSGEVRSRPQGVDLKASGDRNLNLSGGKILFRADAGIMTGTGHVMRSLALAQAWQDRGGEASFLCVELPMLLQERLERQNLSVHVQKALKAGSEEDANWTGDMARQCGASWIVVDGYCFRGAYQKQLTEKGMKVLLFDDYGHSDFYHSDLVLNGNVNADELVYSLRSVGTRLLLGPDYAPLRREFLQLGKKERRPSNGMLHVLVTMGGSDPDNLTSKILRQIQASDGTGFKVTVLAGGGNPYVDEIRSLIGRLEYPCNLLVNAMNIPELMLEADVAIAAGGSTYLEMIYMKLPCLLFILADNQTTIARKLGELAAVRVAGDSRIMGEGEIGEAVGRFLSNRQLHAKLREKCSGLVDGQGAQRIIQAMENRPGSVVRIAEQK